MLLILWLCFYFFITNGVMFFKKEYIRADLSPFSVVETGECIEGSLCNSQSAGWAV